METNKSRERTMHVLEEALRHRDFGAKKGESLSVVEKPLQIDLLDCTLLRLKSWNSLHLDTCALPFRNTPRYLKKIRPLDWRWQTWCSISRKSMMNGTKLWISAILINDPSLLSTCLILENQSDSANVLVPGLTDRDDDLIELENLLRPLKTLINLKFSPYHTMGNSNGVSWEFPTNWGRETTGKRTGPKCEGFGWKLKATRLPGNGSAISCSALIPNCFSNEMHNYSFKRKKTCAKNRVTIEMKWRGRNMLKILVFGHQN